MELPVILQLIHVTGDIKMTNSYFVYLLGSQNKGGFRTYVGWTNDLERRLTKHNIGSGARSTRGRNWQLLYAEKYDSQSAAMSREWHLKKDRNFRSQIIKCWSKNYHGEG